MNLLSAADIFDKHALDYQSRFMDVSAYAGSLERLCGLLPQQANLLELGCGPGNISRFLLGRRPDLRMTATDIAPRMLELAKANNPGADFLLMDCRDLSHLPGTYQAIVCGFVLPYLPQPEAEKLLRDCLGLLKPGGTLYLSFMEANAQQQSGVKTNRYGESIYLHYHETGLILRCLQDLGYSQPESFRITGPGSDGTFSTDRVLLTHKTGIEFE